MMKQQQSVFFDTQPCGYIASLIAERDAALARNRELEDLAQSAHDVLMTVCGDAQDRLDTAHAEIARLKQLIHDINHAHFQNGAYLDYEQWMQLLASTRSDMEAIAAEVAPGKETPDDGEE